ncbi:hypothetical protein GCM10007863_36640 [Dyella mobilis]|nr:hypothetical protein GCM10007863_36640 [Dyella mobilis]
MRIRIVPIGHYHRHFDDAYPRIDYYPSEEARAVIETVKPSKLHRLELQRTSNLPFIALILLTLTCPVWADSGHSSGKLQSLICQ